MIRNAGLIAVVLILLIGVTSYMLLRVRHSEVIYRNTPQTPLRAHVFRPPLNQPVLGAVMFLHGGGWYTGSRRHFVPFARTMAKHGYVAFTVDYRVHGKHGTSIEDALLDARLALDWAREQHLGLGFKSNAITLIGGSAGGHLAACIALQCDSKSTRQQLRSLVLMNPVLDLTNAPAEDGFSSGERKLIAELTLDRRRELSPLHNLDELAIRTLIVFGTADPLYSRYKNTLEEAKVEVVLHQGGEHGFFNAAEVRREISALMLKHLSSLGQS